MKPILKAYKYYRKNFSFLWEKFLADTLVGDNEGYDKMNKFISEKCGVSEKDFIEIVALSYDRKLSRAFK